MSTSQYNVNSMTDFATTIQEGMGPELLLLCCFALGYLLFNSMFIRKLFCPPKSDKITLKQMNAAFDSGDFAEVLTKYESLGTVDLTIDTLRMCLGSLLGLGRFAEAAAAATAAFTRQATLHSQECAQMIVEVFGSTKPAVAMQILEENNLSEMDLGNTREELARGYCATGDISSLRKLNEDGVNCPSEAYTKLSKDAINRGAFDVAIDLLNRAVKYPVSFLVDLVRAAESRARSNEVMNFLGKLQIESDGLIALFEHFDNEGRVDSAEELMSFAEERNMQIPPACYDSLMHLCKNMIDNTMAGKEEVDRTIEFMERSRIVPDDALIAALLEACVRMRDVSRLTSTTAALRRAGGHFTDDTFYTLIHAYGMARSLSMAQDVWADMLSSNVRPSEWTVSAMVEACVSNGAIEDGQAALESLSKAFDYYTPPASAYALLMKGFLARKEMNEALEVYAEMKEAGCDLDDISTFNALIDACARASNTQRAVELFQDMCSVGVEGNLTTYSTIIKGHCLEGALQQALQLFTLMRKKGIAPDVVLFNSILDGCARKQMPALTEQVLNDMQVSGVSPTSCTLCILVKMYGKARDVDMAFHVVESLTEKFSFKPNNQVQICLLSACLGSGRLDQALEVFEEIKDPDAKTYGMLINGYLKHSDVRGAVYMLERAVQAVTVTPEVVNNVIFMAERRRLPELNGLRRTLEKAGLSHSRERSTSPGSNSSTSADECTRAKSSFHARRMTSQQWRSM